MQVDSNKKHHTFLINKINRNYINHYAGKKNVQMFIWDSDSIKSWTFLSLVPLIFMVSHSINNSAVVPGHTVSVYSAVTVTPLAAGYRSPSSQKYSGANISVNIDVFRKVVGGVQELRRMFGRQKTNCAP